jgi:hypothetical protein
MVGGARTANAGVRLMCDTSAICPICQGSLSDSNELSCSVVSNLGDVVSRIYQCACGAQVSIKAEVVRAGQNGST